MSYNDVAEAYRSHIEQEADAKGYKKVNLVLVKML